MARNRGRASMREGPLAELFRATEAAQRQAERERDEGAAPSEAQTVEHVGPNEMTIAEASALPAERKPEPKPTPEPEREPAPAPTPEPAAAASARAGRCTGPARDPRDRGAARGALRRPVAAPEEHTAARVRRLPRGHPRRRRWGRWSQRRKQDDRGRDLPGRVRRGQHRHSAAARLRGADQAPHRTRADPGPRLRSRSRGRSPGGRGRVRPDQARPARLRHGLHHRRRGRRHRHGLRARGCAHRPRARRAHRRHRDDAVQVRGHAPPRAGAEGRGRTARQLRHGHRHPERPAARGARPVDLDARGVPRRRRRAPPGRPGDLRPDHDAGPHQPRLRRRADDHERRRNRPHGHRLLHRGEPWPRGRRARAALAAHRHGDRRGAGHPALDRRRLRPHAHRGQRGGRDDPRGLHGGDEHHLRRDDRRAAVRPGLGHRRRDRDRQGQAPGGHERHRLAAKRGTAASREKKSSTRRASSATSRQAQ